MILMLLQSCVFESEIIYNLNRIASQMKTGGEHYFILLILTDGIITDMPQTCEAVVNVRLISQMLSIN